MNKEELQDYIIQVVIPDIMRCMNENSSHNHRGRFGFECENKILHIDFKWSKNEKK